MERKKRGSHAGRGKGWTRGERVALCRAVREATLNGILAADQQKEDYWGQMLVAMAEQTPDNLSANQMAERWGQRTWSALMVEFTRNISPCCQRFAHFYHVASTTATGNMNEDGILSSARSLYSAAAMYAAEHADAVKDAKRKKSGRAVPVRRSRFVPQNWEPCWQELRTLDKYSGAAANPDIERSFLEGLLSDEDSDDTDEDEEGDTMDGAAAAGAEDPRARPVRGPALMDRPAIGRKALKRRLADDNAEAASLAACDKSMRVVAESLSRRNVLGEEAQKLEKQRMAMDFFNRPENKHTPEGVAFQARMLATMATFGGEPAVLPGARVAAAAASASAGAASRNDDGEEDAGDDGVVVVPLAPAPGTPPSTSANKARGTKSMATKVALAGAALRAAATIDLSLPPHVGGPTRGPVAGAAAAVHAPRANEGDATDNDEDDEREGVH